MSALPAPVARRVPTPTPRPQLAVAAPRRRRRGHIAYLAVCVSLVVGALVTVLVLHVSTSQGSYESFRINQQLADLETQRLAAQEALAKLGAPEVLENKARELGMVPAQNPLFINLAKGSIIGTWPTADEDGDGTGGEGGEDTDGDQINQETP